MLSRVMLAAVIGSVIGCSSGSKSGQTTKPTKEEMIAAYLKTQSDVRVAHMKRIKVLQVTHKSGYTAGRLQWAYVIEGDKPKPDAAKEGLSDLLRRRTLTSVETADCRFSKNDFGEWVAKCEPHKQLRLDAD